METKEWVVSWVIDIEATSPEAAAEQAHEVMRNPSYGSSIFRVDRYHPGVHDIEEHIALIEVDHATGEGNPLFDENDVDDDGKNEFERG